MWRSILALIAVAMFTASVSAGTYRLSLPLVYGEKALGDLPIEVDGMTLTSIAFAPLIELLGNRISKQWVENHFPTERASYISMHELKEKGIDVALDGESLLLYVTLEPALLNEQNVELASQYPNFEASPSGTVSWLNSFNFAYNNDWNDDSQTWSSSIDWLSQMNLGGAEGINVQLANYFESDNETSEFVRGEWTAFHDRPNLPLRFSIGDVLTGESGHIYGMSLGGFSFESSYEQLQPDREISPQSSQQLVLLESAEVEIYVNGERVSGGRLEPGRYNLQNLILDNGANDITVVVNYVSGNQEVLRFTQFYNAKLLEEGLLDYAFSLGRPIKYGNQGVDYEDVWLATGFAEYGLTDWLTVGANGLVAQDGGILGALATFKSPVGNITARYSVSHNERDNSNNPIVKGNQGWIGSIDYENSVIGSGDSQSPNLRLAVEQSDKFNNAPWKSGDNIYANTSDYTQYLANYFWQINNELDLSFAARYSQYAVEGDDILSSVLLNWRRGGLTLGVGTEYEDSYRYSEPDSRWLINFEYNWYSRESANQLGISYNSNNERSRVFFNNEGRNYVGDIGVRIEAEQDKYQQKQKAELSYTANRFRTESEVIRHVNRHDDSESYHGALRLATAIGMVDGHWGWGRTSTGPFVVAALHPTLQGATANLDVNTEGKALALASPNINGLFSVSQPFSSNSMDYTVIDAPLGYDWGDGTLDISPGAATGHYLLMGSDASLSANGYLYFADGKPIAYRQGRIIGDENAVEFFTNKQGRFYIQGVGDGVYSIELYGLDVFPVAIEIPSTSSSLVDLGQIKVECRGECDEE
ncbi:pilus assembly protein PapC [Vibrio sinensis]|uniref:Pilus assembly protein PapC n=1 Tax=Vibrio sinensis TaxID=2302434 RepID=A0A3A6QZ49_9VIBR|nr:pilus assembly protein PapC [Vibrio sinensis]